MYCLSGNATEPIWRVLASSDGIASWTLLKPHHSNPNPYRLAYQLCCIDFLILLTPLIIPPRLPAFLESLWPLANWFSIHARWSNVSLSFFPSLKQNVIAYRSFQVSSRPDCIFEIHQLWKSGFSWVYSNCCCSCSFEAEIIKILFSHLIRWITITYWIFKSLWQFKKNCTKKSGNLLKAPRNLQWLF